MSAGASTPFDSPAAESDASKLGLWVFIASEAVFFGPLFMGYFYGRLHFPEAFEAAARHTQIVIGTVNTAVLLTSSFFMAFAVEARRQGATRLARGALFVTAALGCAFLVLKGFEYHKEWNEHLVPGFGFLFGEPHTRGAEVFFYLYFALTGVHALHLTIGICIVLAFAVLSRSGERGTFHAEHLELAGLYWHFVDVVWIFLYPMIYLLGRAT